METRRTRVVKSLEKQRYSIGDLLISWGMVICIMAAVLAVFVAVVWIIRAIIPG